VLTVVLAKLHQFQEVQQVILAAVAAEVHKISLPAVLLTEVLADIIQVVLQEEQQRLLVQTTEDQEQQLVVLAQQTQAVVLEAVLVAVELQLQVVQVL